MIGGGGDGGRKTLAEKKKGFENKSHSSSWLNLNSTQHIKKLLACSTLISPILKYPWCFMAVQFIMVCRLYYKSKDYNEFSSCSLLPTDSY